jgi:hypothetical protein
MLKLKTPKDRRKSKTNMHGSNNKKIHSPKEAFKK